MIASALTCAHGHDCLPHTGFNLLWVIVIAVVIIAGGIALYRAGRSADVEQ